MKLLARDRNRPPLFTLCCIAFWAFAAPNVTRAATNVLVPTGSRWRYLDDGSDQGTVYVVAGSPGQATFGDLDHPIMYFDELELGSLVLDMEGPVLHARVLRETGGIDDYFTIVKGPVEEMLQLTAHRPDDGTLTLTSNARPARTYRVERTTDLALSNWTPVSPALPAVGSSLNWSTTIIRSAAHATYRVVRSDN